MVTSESRWRRWPRLQELSPADEVSGRIIALSAHPDDEALALGGFLSQSSGHDVKFCIATDGEASHPGSPTMSPGQLADARRVELRTALAALGFAAPEVVNFGLPDSGLDQHCDLLAQHVAAAIEGASLVLCPLTTDGHPDHDLLGKVTGQVCSGRLPVWEYPVWAWHWSTPRDTRLPWDRAHGIELSEATQATKRRAIECFTTQVRPLSEDPADAAILPPEVLAHFARPFEVVFA